MLAQPVARSDRPAGRDRPQAGGRRRDLRRSRSPAPRRTATRCCVGSGGPLAAVPALRKNPPYDPLQRLHADHRHRPLHRLPLRQRDVPAKNVPGVHRLCQGESGQARLRYRQRQRHRRVRADELAAGIDMLHVPYKSAPQAMPDLLSDRVAGADGSADRGAAARAGRQAARAGHDARSPLAAAAGRADDP